MAPPFLPRLFLCLIVSITSIHTPPPAEPPPIHNYPFVAIWNAPTDTCEKLHIELDLAAFKAVTTPAAVPGQYLTIFYEHRLGLYPKVGLDEGEQYHGGIPKKELLKKHLSKAQSQIDHYIPQDSPGLAVIDWESWRPLWDQNWGSKRIYQKLYIDFTKKKNPKLSSENISELVKKQFEEDARRFMEKTIRLGIRMRPSRRWGFYLFPACYNYGWEKPGYTGKCSTKTKRQNNQLLWLWRDSTALFPSIYLSSTLRNSPHVKLFVRNIVKEAQRVAEQPKHPYMVPIYVYSRPVYRDQIQKFLTQMDLVSTVGEAAALGASGIIMWGGSKDFNSKGACRSLSRYLKSTVNPYIANATAAAMLCSQVLCQSNGRCLRKDSDSSHYLHLNPAHFTIRRADEKYVVIGLPSSGDLQAWAQHFTCQCYAGRKCCTELYGEDRRPWKEDASELPLGLLPVF
uniref:Hyaluronidase n=1 Tax=Mola mola TaxID=94237 RepID=A0A3Q3X994_MOLML